MGSFWIRALLHTQILALSTAATFQPSEGGDRFAYYDESLANAVVQIETGYLFRELRCRFADYGDHLHDKNITATKLVLAEPPDLCGSSPDLVPNATEFGPFILIARRGNCFFLNKSLTAQLLGAVALIVIDYKESSSLITMAAAQAKAADVTIPSMLMSWVDGYDLAELATNDPDLEATIYAVEPSGGPSLAELSEWEGALFILAAALSVVIISLLLLRRAAMVFGHREFRGFRWPSMPMWAWPTVRLLRFQNVDSELAGLPPPGNLAPAAPPPAQEPHEGMRRDQPQ